MNRIRIGYIPLFFTLLATAVAFIPGVSATPGGERYIVKFTAAGEVSGRSAVAGAGTIVRDLGRHNAVAAHLPTASLIGLKRNPNVEYVELDPKRYLLSHPTSGEVTPYGISMVQADQVTDIDASSQTVCIIDSGYDTGHEDLPGGTNVTGSIDTNIRPTLPWYEDGVGHGTHVGGTISAIGNNNIGVVGVLPSGTVNLHIVRVFDESGGWVYGSDMVAALDFCVDNGANVINMSLGGGVRSNLEDRGFAKASRDGVLSFAAAGNDGSSLESYPASYDSVVSVAAVDNSRTVAAFSQRNAQVELAAPGVGVLSTVPLAVGVHSDVEVDNIPYGSIAMEGSPKLSATLPLVDCGLGDSVCTTAVGGVCLIQRGDITFAEKVIYCEDSGGLAAIIYNNEAGPLNGTLGGVVTSIPSVGISMSDGSYMFTHQLGTNATVNIEEASYSIFEGTSIATSHASGVAALVWSRHSSCTGEEVRNALNASALDLGAPGRDIETGYGLVQAKSATDWLELNGCDGGDGGTGGICELLAKGDYCEFDTDCCSNKCKGKPGAKTCK